MHTLSFGLTCVLTCGIPFGLVIAAVVMPLAHAQENYPVRPGRLRGLGVSSATRLRALPDTPTIAESGVPGFEAMQWAGLLAPAGTPREIVARLHKEAASTRSRPELMEHVVRDGSVVVAGTPEAFAAFIKAEITQWAGVVKAAGIQPE